MQNKNKKKTIGVMIVVAALLAGAILLNIKLNKSSQTQNSVDDGENVGTTYSNKVDNSLGYGVGADYFASFRTTRESTRDKEIEYLNAIIHNESTDAETLADAQKQLLEIVDCMEKELTIENLIKAKGFADAAVTFHYGSVNVVVDCTELTNEQVAQILDIVTRETGEPAANIKISPSKK